MILVPLAKVPPPPCLSSWIFSFGPTWPPPSAQGQYLPPAKLLVLARQPAAPGTALQFNQKPGFTEGRTQSLAGKSFKGRKEHRYCGLTTRIRESTQVEGQFFKDLGRWGWHTVSLKQRDVSKSFCQPQNNLECDSLVAPLSQVVCPF